MNPPEPIRSDELDIVGEVFGIRFTEGCSNGCIELYGEDDGFWHLITNFDRGWLDDLTHCIDSARAFLNKEKTDEQK